MGAATDYMDAVSVIKPSGDGRLLRRVRTVAVPSQRTEYYSAGTPAGRACSSSFPLGEFMIDPARTYKPGSSRTEDWYGGILAPTAARDLSGSRQLAAERQGNLIGSRPGFWGDSRTLVSRAGPSATSAT